MLREKLGGINHRSKIKPQCENEIEKKLDITIKQIQRRQEKCEAKHKNKLDDKYGKKEKHKTRKRHPKVHHENDKNDCR